MGTDYGSAARGPQGSEYDYQPAPSAPGLEGEPGAPRYYDRPFNRRFQGKTRVVVQKAYDVIPDLLLSVLLIKSAFTDTDYNELTTKVTLVVTAFYVIYSTLGAYTQLKGTQKAYEKSLLGYRQDDHGHWGLQDEQNTPSLLTPDELKKYNSNNRAHALTALYLLTAAGLIASPVCYATNNPQYGVAALGVAVITYTLTGVLRYLQGKELYESASTRRNNENGDQVVGPQDGLEFEPKFGLGKMAQLLAGLAILGAGVFLLFRYTRDISASIKDGEENPNPHSLGILVSQIVALVGVGTISSLFSSYGSQAYEEAIDFRGRIRSSDEEHGEDGAVETKGVLASTVFACGITLDRELATDLAALPIVMALSLVGYTGVKGVQASSSAIISGCLAFTFLYRFYSSAVQNITNQVSARIIDQDRRIEGGVPSALESLRTVGRSVVSTMTCGMCCSD